MGRSNIQGSGNAVRIKTADDSVDLLTNIIELENIEMEAEDGKAILSIGNVLPEMSSSTNGKFLTNDGVEASWNKVSAIEDLVLGTDLSLSKTVFNKLNQNISTSSGSYGSWYDFCYNPVDHKCMLLSANGRIYEVSDITQEITGAPLTLGTGYSSYTWRSICYGNNKYVALSSQGGICTGTGGNNWDSCISGTTSGLGSHTWYSICYGNNKYVALGSSGYVSTSTDGTTWSTPVQDTNLGSHSWYDLCFDGTRFVALSSSNYLSYSVDGVTWASASAILPVSSGCGICFDGTKYLVLNSYGIICTSTDLINWNTLDDDPLIYNISSNYWYRIRQVDNGIVILARTPYAVIAYSSDISQQLDCIKLDRDGIGNYGTLGGTTTPIYLSNGKLTTCSFSWSTIYAITSYNLAVNSGITYFTLNNGMKVELGTFSLSANTGTISTYYTYTSASSYKVFLQHTSSKAANYYLPHIKSQTKNSFTYYSGSYSNLDTGVYYIAIGY